MAVGPIEWVEEVGLEAVDEDEQIELVIHLP